MASIIGSPLQSRRADRWGGQAGGSRRIAPPIGRHRQATYVARATTALRLRRPAANPHAPPHSATHAPMPTCRVDAPATRARIHHPKKHGRTASWRVCALCMTISAYIRVIDDMPISSPAAHRTRKTRAFSLSRLRFTVTRRHRAAAAIGAHGPPHHPQRTPIPAQPRLHATSGYGPRTGLPTETSRPVYRRRPASRRRPNHAIKGK